MYQRRRGGQVALTEEAVRYRETVKAKVVNNLGKVVAFPIHPEYIYRFEVILYFEALENPGWFEICQKDEFYTRDSKDGKHRRGELKCKIGQRMAATRYKRIDYDNRIKFLQDCVAKSVGIPDDSQIFMGHQEKREDTNNPRAEVNIQVIDNIQQFFPKRWVAPIEH